MPTKGQIITNPTNGNTFEFIETAKDTHGERVTIKATIHSKGKAVPNHFHVLQDESFEVLTGNLTLWLDGKTLTLTAGEEFTFPRAIPYKHFNSEDEPVSYLLGASPALDFDYLIENLVGLEADGKSKDGKYGLLQELVTLKFLDSKIHLSKIPLGLQ